MYVCLFIDPSVHLLSGCQSIYPYVFICMSICTLIVSISAMSVDETVPEDLNQSIQIGIGCAVGVFVCFILIVGIVCWYKRCRPTKSAKTEEVSVMYGDGTVSCVRCFS